MWTDEGAIILKFFLSLDKDIQLERFKAREVNPDKQWKITDEDWRNRDKWDLYLEASADMIQKQILHTHLGISYRLIIEISTYCSLKTYY